MDFDQVAVNGVNSNGEDFGMSVNYRNRKDW
ncbi:hypothetical protein CK5_02180 [Blautia obeum A2-162]|uniref:Uncharacterized protein n=1 Tax=Blautia obeum A2-162 TaxID=657314 RepID=D4LW46_9FIRM|nr:hypothetical protein CK5_02180 [Blautia obeum A2-162]